MLQCLDGADVPTHQGRDRIQRQIRDEPQDDDVALIRRQLAEGRLQLGIERLGLRRGRRGRVGCQAAPAFDAPALVDESVVRDGEDPAAQRVIVAFEA